LEQNLDHDDDESDDDQATLIQRSNTPKALADHGESLSPRKHRNKSISGVNGKPPRGPHHHTVTTVLSPPVLVSPPYASSPELASMSTTGVVSDDDGGGGDDDDLVDSSEKNNAIDNATTVVDVQSGGVQPSPVSGSLDANSVFYLTNVFALVLLFPAWAAFDATEALPNLINDGLHTWILLTVTSLAVVAQHFASIFVLEAASTPVTHAVAATCKRIFVIVTSIVWFGNRIAPMNGLGICLSVCGVALYDRSGRPFRPQQDTKKKSRQRPKNHRGINAV